MAFNKLKQWLFKLNLKVVINMAVFGFVVILIIICTIIQVGLDFSQINWATWAANSLLLIGITMIGQISFEGIFTSYLYQKDGWKYQKAKDKYKEVLERVGDFRIYLWQYLEYFQKQELRKARIDILSRCGIDNPTLFVDNFKLSEIKELAQHPIYKKEIDYTWDKLTDFQKERVYFAYSIETETKKITHRESGLIIDNPGADYYLSLDSEIVMTSILNEPKILNKKIKSNQFFGRTLKIISYVIVSIIWSSFTISEIASGNDPVVYMNLFARLFALFGGALGGIMTSMGTVSIITRKINSKTEVLKNFLTAMDLEEFTPQSQSDIAKRHYEDYVKKQKEAVDSVVDIKEEDKHKFLEGGVINGRN